MHLALRLHRPQLRSPFLTWPSVKPQVMEILERDGVVDLIGRDYIHSSVPAAVATHLKKYPPEEGTFQDLIDLLNHAKSG